MLYWYVIRIFLEKTPWSIKINEIKDTKTFYEEVYNILSKPLNYDELLQLIKDYDH